MKKDLLHSPVIFILSYMNPKSFWWIVDATINGLSFDYSVTKTLSIANHKEILHFHGAVDKMKPLGSSTIRFFSKKLKPSLWCDFMCFFIWR